MKVDQQHLQLLEILAQNCRVPHAELGRALRLSKDTITYRLRQLEESKLLKEYVLFIDARKIGFTRYHILVQLDNLSNVDGIYQKLAKHEFIMWVNSFIGSYDFQIIVDALDGFHLNSIREQIFSLCQGRIKNYTILTHLEDLEFTQLNPLIDFGTNFDQNSDQSFSKELTTRKFPVDVDFKTYALDQMDLKILSILALDPRASLVTIAENANCERQTVKSRIKKLIDRKIILSFSAIPNLKQLGFVTYYLLVRLEQDTTVKEMKSPFLDLNNIFYAGRMLGDYDIILYLNARNPDELNKSIKLFRDKLKHRIIKYDLLVQDELHHWRQYTPGIHRVLSQKITS
jgi:DNA-binding Lrp family transcriptional regulator